MSCIKMNFRYICVIYIATLFIGISGKLRNRISGEKLIADNPSLDIEPRIVDGVAVNPAHLYPWQASLISQIGVDKAVFCGGMIIDTHFVLTAAHCVDGIPADEMLVVLGDHLLNVEEGTEQVLGVAEVFESPTYNEETLDKDYALLKLESPGAIFNDDVTAVSLAKKFKADGDCVVTGWGTEKLNGSVSNVLQQATVDVTPNAYCRDVYASVIDITSNMLCAGTGTSGSCSGDSGGPLVCRKGNDWIAEGITSWGAECGLVGVPDVYTRISSIYDDIMTVVNKDDDSDDDDDDN